MQRFWLVCLIALLCTAPAWGQSVTPRTDIWEFQNGIRLCDNCTTITGSTTAGNAAVVLPNSSIGAAEMAGTMLVVTYCGENAENGTTYFGPAALTAAHPVLADTACDALDNVTEATADVVLSAGLTLYPRYMRCITDGTLGAAETLTFQLRDDAASVTGVTCALAVGETVCEVLTPTAGAIAAGSATAVSVIEVSNNADDNALCRVWYAIQ